MIAAARKFVTGFAENYIDHAIRFGGSGYDATGTTGRRRSPKSRTASEDSILNKNGRTSLVATTRDCRRNFAVAAWAIRKHLDFVVSHTFRASTGDVVFNRKLEKFVARLSRKDRFDAQQRHPRRRWMRIAEAGRVVDGDLAAVKLGGGFLQAIEGDRIRDPEKIKRKANGTPRENWINGMRVDRSGRVREVSIHRREGRGFRFERKVKAERCIHFAYFDRFDQYRGVSPMAPAINSLKDLYDDFDYTSAKNKVAQLFALAIYRESTEGFANGYDDEGNAKSAEDYRTHDIDFNKGPQFLDLNQGERAEFLANDNPSANEHKFWQQLIGVALKSLDIPFSFYDEAYTNFFGSRSALTLYLKSTDEKRADVQDFLNDWLCWRLKMAIADGELDAPVGFECDSEMWSWIPSGTPWWNPAQEIKADVTAIDNLLRTQSEIRQERFGDDWFDVVDRAAEEKAYLEEKGLQRGSVEQIQQVEVANDVPE